LYGIVQKNVIIAFDKKLLNMCKVEILVINTDVIGKCTNITDSFAILKINAKSTNFDIDSTNLNTHIISFENKTKLID
jgi:hypothetical protein